MASSFKRKRSTVSVVEVVDSEEGRIQRHIQNLQSLISQHLGGEGEEELEEAFKGFVDAAAQERRDITKTLNDSRDSILKAHVDAASDLLADESLSNEEKAALLDDMKYKEQLLGGLLSGEQARQEDMFERFHLETSNRRMRKMKQRHTRDQNLNALVESGDATQTDRTAHQLQAEMDDQMEAQAHNLNVAYATKIAEAIAQEQNRLMDALAQAGRMTEDEADQFLASYEEEVQRIENGLRNELQKALAELEQKGKTTKEDRATKLFPFASPVSYYVRLLSKVLGVDSLTHLVILTRTAHPAILMAALELKLETVCYVEGA